MSNLFLTRKIILLHIAVVCSLAIPSPNNSQVLDSPHNVQGCLSCHFPSAFDESNLIPGGSDPVYVGICEGCHNGTTLSHIDDLPLENMATHSSVTTGSSRGPWYVGCKVCHNQHKQEQEDVYGTTYGKFIKEEIDLSLITDVEDGAPLKSGKKQVKFTSQTGKNSFADGDSTIDGICEVCHTETNHWRNDGTLAGEGIHTGLEGSNCLDCHFHTIGLKFDHSEANVHASVGNCEYCHADPRPSAPLWNAFPPGDNGNNYGTNVPTQMACRECHVSFDDVGGMMTVTKFSRTEYSNYKTDYTKTVVHTLENADLATLGRINNYGICLGCHDGTTTTAVTVWHARPDIAGSWVYGVSDAARCTGTRIPIIPGLFPDPDNQAQYAPGRSSGTIGKFNLFMDPGFGYTPGPADFDECSDYTNYQTTPLTFTRIAIPAVIGNGNTSGSVPVFPSLAPMTP